MLYWQAKSSAKTPQIHNFWGSKWPLFTPKTAWIKIAQNRSLGFTDTEMAKTVTLGSANP